MLIFNTGFKVFNINHILQEDFGAHCLFCFSRKGINQEHILPKWMFESSRGDFFTTTLNSYGSSYMKSTLPACSECNNIILSSLERFIVRRVSTFYNPSDLDEIMLWLEILSYKLHVYDFKLRFIKNFAENRFIPYLKDFSHAALRGDFPGKCIRKSFDRLLVKKKAHRINSFVFFITKINPNTSSTRLMSLSLLKVQGLAVLFCTFLKRILTQRKKHTIKQSLLLKRFTKLSLPWYPDYF